MKGKRYTEEQIIRILKEVEEGKAIAQVCREQGVSEQSVYRWRSKYGGMDVPDLRRLKQLEDENRRLKTLVAECQAPDLRSNFYESFRLHGAWFRRACCGDAGVAECSEAEPVAPQQAENSAGVILPNEV